MTFSLHVSHTSASAPALGDAMADRLGRAVFMHVYVWGEWGLVVGVWGEGVMTLCGVVMHDARSRRSIGAGLIAAHACGHTRVLIDASNTEAKLCQPPWSHAAAHTDAVRHAAGGECPAQFVSGAGGKHSRPSGRRLDSDAAIGRASSHAQIDSIEYLSMADHWVGGVHRFRHARGGSRRPPSKAAT